MSMDQILTQHTQWEPSDTLHQNCHGQAKPPPDVFAYGTLLLEVVCGRRPIETTAVPRELLLLDCVRKCWMKGKLLEALDPRLGESYVREKVDLVLKLGLLCSQSVPEAMPTMR